MVLTEETTKVISLATPLASYDIHIGQGLLGDLHARLQVATAGKPYRAFVVTSPAIWELWGQQLAASFAAGQVPAVLMLPAGEEHKRLAAVESLAEQLAAAGADRDALLIAFGGGVIGDITGFLTAIYMRGVRFVQVPTTLLAQVDSSVGGKTGVNLAAGKNLIGSFHHPLAVYADLDLLRTLPAEELRAGLQESVKAGIICDADLLRFLVDSREAVLGLDAAALARVVGDSVRIKAEVVMQDERESGLRMKLNFGHTLGHAIEAATKYKVLLHGEAVAWGSIAALHVGLRRGAIDPEQFRYMSSAIYAYGPLPSFEAGPVALVKLTAGDKKARSGRRAFVMPTGVGQVEVVYDVTDEELLRGAEAMVHDMQAGKGR